MSPPVLGLTAGRRRPLRTRTRQHFADLVLVHDMPGRGRAPADVESPSPTARRASEKFAPHERTDPSGRDQRDVGSDHQLPCPDAEWTVRFYLDQARFVYAKRRRGFHVESGACMHSPRTSRLGFRFPSTGECAVAPRASSGNSREPIGVESPGHRWSQERLWAEEDPVGRTANDLATELRPSGAPAQKAWIRPRSACGRAPAPRCATGSRSHRRIHRVSPQHRPRVPRRFEWIGRCRRPVRGLSVPGTQSWKRQTAFCSWLSCRRVGLGFDPLQHRVVIGTLHACHPVLMRTTGYPLWTSS